MAKAIYYPPASQTAQWFNGTYRGADIEPNVMVWHTTETGGWPSYGGGASAPHLTYHPEDHKWRQHFRLDRSSRALRNRSGGVETNTLNACQVEIIAYSDETLARSRGHLPVSDLNAEALRDLGDFAAFMWDEWGLKLDIDAGWEYTGDRSPERMSGSQWRGFYGHTGHNRVPENTHWDPARLDIDTIINHAKGDDMPLDNTDLAKIEDLLTKKRGEFGFGSTVPISIATPGARYAWGGLKAANRIEDKVDALLAAQEGLDTAAVLERIDARYAEAAQQRQVIAETMTAKLDAIVDATQGSDPAEAKLAAILEILGVGD